MSSTFILDGQIKTFFTYQFILEPKAIPACLNISKTLMKYLSPHTYSAFTHGQLESNCLSILKSVLRHLGLDLHGGLQ
jgi:hypothetical protein